MTLRTLAESHRHRWKRGAEGDDDPEGAVPCCYGFLYVVGEGTLGAWVRGKKRLELEGLPGVTCAQREDTEAVFTFPVSLYDSVARVMKPKRRRVLSPARREACAATLKAALATRQGIAASGTPCTPPDLN